MKFRISIIFFPKIDLRRNGRSTLPTPVTRTGAALWHPAKWKQVFDVRSASETFCLSFWRTAGRPESAAVNKPLRFDWQPTPRTTWGLRPLRDEALEQTSTPPARSDRHDGVRPIAAPGHKRLATSSMLMRSPEPITRDNYGEHIRHNARLSGRLNNGVTRRPSWSP
jgi:hypothetical protein